MGKSAVLVEWTGSFSGHDPLYGERFSSLDHAGYVFMVPLPKKQPAIGSI
jgi:hypothetical protein